MGRSSTKAIDLLNQDKYKILFNNQSLPSEDILLPYKIYFNLFRKTEFTSILDDQIFWNECCKYFLVEKIGIETIIIFR